MAATSPTPSIKLREIIGTDAFSQRREVFGQHETVFLPSPTSVSPKYVEVEPIITSNQGKSISNFRRTPAYSSMRENRKDDIRNELGFRERKHSDNFSSDLYQSDDVDYRHSMTERNRRLSKLRRDFLTSNLHEPSNSDPFVRVGTRASLPAKSTIGTYKIESPTIYKFPFAEPFSTPPPVRRVFVDLGPIENGDTKENDDPKEKKDKPKEEIDSPVKHKSLPNDKTIIEVDHHKLFHELVNRYSPQRKPIDWTLPPTKPRVVGTVRKTNSIDETITENKLEIVEDNDMRNKEDETNIKDEEKIQEEANDRLSKDSKQSNGQKKEPNGLQRDSSDELDEKNDQVPELSNILQRQTSRESQKNKHVTKEDTIPQLLQKIENEEPKTSKQMKKKVKRKRSFLDKLFNRKKSL